MTVIGNSVNDLLNGPLTSPLLNYAGVILIHGINSENITLPKETKVTVQIARFDEELPLLSTKSFPLSKSITEEVLVVHSETLEELELLLCTESEVIDEFELKLSRYHAMQYHHVSLNGQNSELFITLVLKTKTIPPSVAPKMDVQLLVQHLEQPLTKPRGNVVVIGKHGYTQDFTNLPFNQPDQVQVSLPAGPSDQPQWYHTFLFQECEITHDIHLALFHSPFINKHHKWSLGNKIGDVVVTLTGNLLKLLQDNQNGVVFTEVPITTTALESTLSLRIIMKLGVDNGLSPKNIPKMRMPWSKVNDALFTVGGRSNTPVPPATQGNAISPHATKAKADFTPQSMSEDTLSIENLLPSPSAINNLLQQHKDSSDTLTTFSTDAPVLNRVIEQQSSQIKEYRIAIHKVGGDLSLCKEKILALQKENSELREIVNAMKQPTLDTSLVTVPREVLIKEVLRSRKMLLDKDAESTSLTEQVKHLKLSLRQHKKDSEDIVELRNAHMVQNQLLQKLQEKVKTTQILEKTCKDQEKVIERLETLLKQYKIETEPTLLPPNRFGSFMQRPHLTSGSAAVNVNTAATKLNNNPPKVDLPRLYPLSSSPPKKDLENQLPVEAALKLRVSQLENEIRITNKSHKDEISHLTTQKTDLQLKLLNKN